MSFFTVASEGSDDFLVRVDDDIADEGQFSRFSCIEHVFMDGVSLQNPCAGLGAVDEFRAMVCQNRDLAGNARQDGFTAARHAGEEMRFNKTFRNEQVSISCHLVDAAVPTRWQRADADHVFVVAADMDDEFFMFRNFLAVFINQFFLRRSPVHARCDEDSNIDIRVPFAQFCQELRHDDVARYRAGMVAGNDDAVLLPLC